VICGDKLRAGGGEVVRWGVGLCDVRWRFGKGFEGCVYTVLIRGYEVLEAIFATFDQRHVYRIPQNRRNIMFSSILKS
jgi:hypothetical protein